MARNSPRNLPTNPSLGLTPMQIGQQRRRIGDIVSKNLDEAQKVLEGTVKWDTSQVRVFVALLNKVVPDVSINAHLHEHAETDPKRMTREQLEKMAQELAERADEEKRTARKKAIQEELDETIVAGPIIETSYSVEKDE